MTQLAKKRRRPPDFYLCIAPRDKSAVVEFITTGSNALGEAHFHLCLHCQSLIMAGATAMRDKIVSALRATKETFIPVNRALEIIAEVTVEDL